MKNKEKLYKLIEKPLLEIGIKVVDILFVTEAEIDYLRIIIDKDSYINIDDCVEATKIIDKIIDDVEISDDSYILDVCSKQKGGSIDG